MTETDDVSDIFDICGTSVDIVDVCDEPVLPICHILHTRTLQHVKLSENKLLVPLLQRRTLFLATSHELAPFIKICRPFRLN